jgi:hypothetical protein
VLPLRKSQSAVELGGGGGGGGVWGTPEALGAEEGKTEDGAREVTR